LRLKQSRSPGATEAIRFNWRDACSPGIAAVKHGWPPILLIQFLAACLVVFYYRTPSFQAELSDLERVKADGGIPFDLATGAFAGGFVPQIAKLITGRANAFRSSFWRDMLFAGFVYAIVAVEVDLFYHLQTATFGSHDDVFTLSKKDLIDMGLFSPFLSIPTAVVLFEWHNSGFSLRNSRDRMRRQFYSLKVMPALIPCWAFWIPVLLCVYAMPINLQFPLSQLAEASWATLFIFIASDKTNNKKPLAQER